MAHVFISYSHEDGSYARRYAEELQRRGFDVWIDERIDYGERWFKEISKAIQSCAAFSVIMTPAAEESEWVEREILVAQKHNKPIFPLRLDGREFDLLITTQYADVRGGALPADDFFARLRQVIAPGAAPKPYPTLVDAREMMAQPGMFLENRIVERLTALLNATGLIAYGVNAYCKFSRVMVHADYVSLVTSITSTKDDPLMLPLSESWQQQKLGEGHIFPALNVDQLSSAALERGSVYAREWKREPYASRLHEVAREIITVNENLGVRAEDIEIECSGF